MLQWKLLEHGLGRCREQRVPEADRARVPDSRFDPARGASSSDAMSRSSGGSTGAPSRLYRPRMPLTDRPAPRAGELEVEAAEALSDVGRIVHRLACHLDPGVGRKLTSTRRLGADHELGVDAAPAQQKPEHERATEAPRADYGPPSHEPAPPRQRGGRRPGSVATGGRRERAASALAVRLKPRRRNDVWTRRHQHERSQHHSPLRGVSERRRASLRCIDEQRARCAARSAATAAGRSTSTPRSTSYSSTQRIHRLAECRSGLDQLPEAGTDALEPVVLLVVEVEQHRLVGDSPREDAFGTLSLLCSPSSSGSLMS